MVNLNSSSTTMDSIHATVGNISTIDQLVFKGNYRHPNVVTKQNSVFNEFPRIHDLSDLSDPYTQIRLLAIIIGCILFIVIGILFIRQISNILGTTPPKFLSRTLSLCGIYGIVGGASLTSLIIYKSNVICDSICHFAFLMCAYQFYCLCIEYAGGETSFIKRTGGLLSFTLQTPPLCCCLAFLEPSAMTKKKFIITRVMVLQMPIIQGIILVALNIINIVDAELYNEILIYFVPFIVSSIMTGVWALQITARMISPYLPEYKIMGKYFAVQLVLIFCKLQPAIIQLICFTINSMNQYRITTKIMENVVTQLLILVEIVLLSLLASRLYKVPIKGAEPY